MIIYLPLSTSNGNGKRERERRRSRRSLLYEPPTAPCLPPRDLEEA